MPISPRKGRKMPGVRVLDCPFRIGTLAAAARTNRFPSSRRIHAAGSLSRGCSHSVGDGSRTHRRLCSFYLLYKREQARAGLPQFDRTGCSTRSGVSILTTSPVLVLLGFYFIVFPRFFSSGLFLGETRDMKCILVSELYYGWSSLREISG